MLNYLIKIEYDGTNFVGWQSQKNGKSIQDTIESALKKVLNLKIRISGAGRTDKGVHAYSQYANFKLKNKITNMKKFLESVNYFLRRSSISILEVKIKKKNFNARFDAKNRIYEYVIVNRQGSLKIDKNRAWHVKKKIDIDLLKKGGKIFEGVHDFSTFRAASCSAQSPIKKMESVKIKKKGDKIFIIFKSKSFLQNQVRSMVGCLIYLATYKWNMSNFNRSLQLKKRSECAPPAPAHGLYLKKIIY